MIGIKSEQLVRWGGGGGESVCAGARAREI